MGVTLSASTPVRLATDINQDDPTFALLAGGGFVASTGKVNGRAQLQVFSDAGAPVGTAASFAVYSGASGDSYGVLRLAALTGGSFVAVTTDNTVHSGQTDIVARVYSAAGALVQTLVVDSAPSGATEFAPSVASTADGGFQVVWTDDSSRGSTSLSGDRPTPNGNKQTITQGRDVFAHAFSPVNGTWTSKTPGDVQVNASGFFTDGADQQTDSWGQSSARLTNGNVVTVYNDQPVHPFTEGGFNQWTFGGGVSFSVLGADAQPVVGRTVVRDQDQGSDALRYIYIGDQSVSAAGSGFVVMFDERDVPPGQSYYQGVHLHFYNADGSSASNDVAVTAAGTDALYPKATALANGAGVAVLYETEHANRDLVARNLYIETFDTSGHVLSGPTLVTDQLQRPGGSGYPQANYTLATRADGSVQVVWEQSDAGHTNLQSEVFSVMQTVTLPAAVATAEANVLRVDPNAASSQALNATLATQGQTAAVATIVAAAVSTSEVATLDYQFFTGHTPSAAGMDYLVSPTGPNPNNLNSGYYAQFSTTNRYINFASNLGKVGEGASAFQANYGALSLTDATTKAYAAIFGTAPTADKVSHLLHDTVPNGVGGTYQREDYFASYGQDGLNGQGTKAAMVGWLLSQAAQADLGTYAKSNDAFLTDVANSQASFGVDLIGAYAKPGYAYMGG